MVKSLGLPLRAGSRSWPCHLSFSALQRWDKAWPFWDRRVGGFGGREVALYRCSWAQEGFGVGLAK